MSRRRSLLAAAVLAMGASGAHAAEASAEVDIELLEFLGSLDGEDEEWRDFLAERPVRGEMGKPAGKTGGEPGTLGPATQRPAPEPDKVKKP